MVLWGVLGSLLIAQATVPANALVAVIELRNKLKGAQAENADTTYLTDAIRSAVLEARPVARLMTRDNMLVLLGEKDMASCEGRCEVETGRLLGADLVISGELTRFGSSYKLSLRLHETRQGELLSAALASGESLDALDKATPAVVQKLLAPVPRNAPAAIGPALEPVEIAPAPEPVANAPVVPAPVAPPSPAPSLSPSPSPPPAPAADAARTLIRPGEGIGSLRIGASTPDDILAAYGPDCRVDRDETGVRKIDYMWDRAWNYKPRRDGASERPAIFEFRDGILRKIVLGPQQTALATANGLGINSTRDQIVAAFGEGYAFQQGYSRFIIAQYPAEPPIDRYVWPGVEFDVDQTSGIVQNITLVAR